MSPPQRRLVFVLSVLGTVAVHGAAFAQDAPDPDALFKRGVEEMNASNYESGCKDIAESRRLKPLPGTLFSLATCMDRWGRVATAVALYGEYLTVYEGLPDDRKAKQGARPQVAKEQREKLRPDVPELTLSLPPNAPAGTQIKRDGQEMPATALGVAFSVDPGELLITTQAPGGPVFEQRITLAKGEKKKVSLEVKPALIVAPPPKIEPTPQPPTVEQPRKVEPPPNVSDGMSAQRKAAFAIGGVGIVGLALGAAMGGLTIREKGTIEQHCGDAIGAPKARCDPAGLDAAHSSQAFGLASTIGFAVGGAGLGVGLVLILTSRTPAPPKAGTAPQWIGAEILPAGPDGAILRAHGVF